LVPLLGFSAVTAIVELASADVRARLEQLPGIRTFASPRFRRAAGLVLLAAGLIYLAMLLFWVTRAGALEIDFVAAYRRASLDLLSGHSPYLPEQMSHPFPANGRYGWYLYPPVLAQMLTPIALLPETLSALVWLALQASMLFAATWMATSAAGARPGGGRVIWTAVTLVFFLPAHEVLWTGNIGGPLALAVAGLLAVRPPMSSMATRPFLAGVLTGAVAVFKLMPIAWLPATLRDGRPVARGAVVGVVGLIVPSILLAPQAWNDYLHVIPNLLFADARYANNLSPAIVTLNLGLPDALVNAVRVLALAAALGFVLASMRAARTPGGWPAAVACGVIAGLLLPAAIWYHYLVLLLPLAAFVWVRASIGARALLVIAGAFITVGMTIPLLAAGGTFAMAVTIVQELWPATSSRVAGVA
jgi:hypothetical protein